MKDLLVDEHGDIVIDSVTHDLKMIDGVDEVAQRIRATLLIRLGEMQNLAIDQGTDYTNFFVKNFNKNIAQTDMVDAIENNVPEVDQVTNISFEELPNRGLKVSFTANVTLDDGTHDIAKGGLELGD